MKKFYIEDHNRIADLIERRKEDAVVMPLYVRIYNELVDLRSLDEIDNYAPSAMKVGFGARYGLFDPKPQFPLEHLYDVEVVDKFTLFNSEINNDIQYYVFESSDPYGNINHPMFEQMAYYYWMIRDYLEDRMKIIRANKIKEMMESEES